MRLRFSIRSLLLLAVAAALATGPVLSMANSSGNLDAIMFVVCFAALFIAVPGAAASCSHDIWRTRRSAELGGIYAFFVLAALGVLLGMD